MSKIILFLLLTLLPACGSFDDHWSVDVLDHPQSSLFSKSYLLTEKLRLALDDAQAELCEKTSHCPTFDGGSSRLHFVSQVPSKSRTDALGNTRFYQGGDIMWISSQLSQNVTRLVLIHELGHTHGCHHSLDENDIMFPAIDPTGKNIRAQHISEHDIECMNGERTFEHSWESEPCTLAVEE